MSKKRAIELFRTGEHTDSAGHSHKFTADHVAAIANSYDKSAAPAPVVVGHPAMDAPAYGWVDGLAFNAASGKLDASLDLHDEMEQAITAKHFNRVSAAFFAPEHPSNPKPGSFYLRHVGLLGAAAPAVTGLKPFGFADNGEAHAFADKNAAGPVLNIEFALDTGGSKGVLEQLADALFAAVGKKTLATAITLNPVPNFTAPPASQENRSMMTDAEKVEFQAAKDRVTALEKQLKDSATLAHTAAANTFANDLIVAKKIDPARKAEVVATYMAMAQAPEVEFATTDGSVSKVSALASWKKTMEGAPPVINTDAKTAPTDKPRGVVATSFSAPSGATIDSDAAETHNKTLAYMAKHGIKDYAQALTMVMAGETAQA
jgi:hypothetical protein